MSALIPIFNNSLGAEEALRVMEVFSSRWLGQGQNCKAFEEEWARHLGVDGNVLLTNNCTSATMIALRALGIGQGDEVILPTIHFVGVANAILEVGAVPVFADVDEHTLNILPSEIDRLCTPRTKAVFLLHYGGHPCDMYEVETRCDDRRLLILEDAANGPASTFCGKAVGVLGDAGVWSFDAMKVLVMGDGGALWTRDDGTYKWAYSYRYLGFPPKQSSGTDSMKEHNSRWWEYDLACHSGRYISNDIMAAIGRVQLKKLAQFVERRHQIWDRYQDELADLEWLTRPPEPLTGCTTSYYLYWIQCDERDALARYLADNGVYSTFRYYPLHRVKYYGWHNAKFPNADRAADRTLCLPLHQNLTGQDIDKIVSAVKSFKR